MSPEQSKPAVVVPPPVGVPVGPIGVCWLLCWPAPTGALRTAGLGGLPWAIAVPISFAISQPLAYALGQVMFQANLDFQYNLLAVGVWLVVIVVISTLASILPARNATAISVRDSLAYS